jgi:hypothetical protein
VSFGDILEWTLVADFLTGIESTSRPFHPTPDDFNELRHSSHSSPMALFLPTVSKEWAELCGKAWQPGWRGGLYENQRMPVHCFPLHRIFVGISQALFCLSTKTTNSDFQFTTQGSAY